MTMLYPFGFIVPPLSPTFSVTPRAINKPSDIAASVPPSRLTVAVPSPLVICAAENEPPETEIVPFDPWLSAKRTFPFLAM